MLSTTKQRLMDTGEEIETFHLTTRKGWAHGFYLPSKDEIRIHHIAGQRCMKGIMGALVRRYKTRQYRFLMVVTDALERKLKGSRVEIIPADAPSNPFGEPIRELVGEWEAKNADLSKRG